MNTTIILAVMLYLIAGIGFTKMWASKVSGVDGGSKFFACTLWPFGLVISAFWSW
ncbi:hypothetical protein [Klebsiella grimontii]|uniref:hypothetical protein n=1 Tax=Klebsiella grimontii TaxID=2058152 RepID=UPI0015B342C4|nr:hypothetical protein [Klebsiella grimontii]